jgi:lambda repressor-like predicted transcriptional regulator
MRVNHVQLAILNRYGAIHERALAKRLGCSRSAVNMTLLGARRNPDLQDRIADYLGFDPEDLWGRWYGRSNRFAATGN